MCHCGQSKQWLPTMFDLFVAPCTVQKFHFSSSYCVRLPLNQRTQAVAQRGQNLFEIAIVFLMRFHKICSRNFKCIANYYPFHIQSIKENDRFREGTSTKLLTLLFDSFDLDFFIS